MKKVITFLIKGKITLLAKCHVRRIVLKAASSGGLGLGNITAYLIRVC